MNAALSVHQYSQSLKNKENPKKPKQTNNKKKTHKKPHHPTTSLNDKSPEGSVFTLCSPWPGEDNPTPQQTEMKRVNSCLAKALLQLSLSIKSHELKFLLDVSLSTSWRAVVNCIICFHFHDCILPFWATTRPGFNGLQITDRNSHKLY